MTDPELRYDQRPEFRAMDDAIRDWFQTTTDAENWMVTGWIVLAACTRIVAGDVETFALEEANNSGMSYHARLGMLADAHHRALNPRFVAADDEDDDG